MLRRLAAAALGAALLPLAPAAAQTESLADYTDCLSAISDNPERAWEEALAWRARGGGWAAEHCIGLSMIALGEQTGGASRLRAAAEGAITAAPDTRAVMFGQAGDAWAAAGEHEDAASAYERGLDFAPDSSGLALGRAEAALALDDPEAAEAWASRALALDPEFADAYRVRGEARLDRRDLEGAESDMQAGRALAPDNIDLLLLRGHILEARRTGQVITLD